MHPCPVDGNSIMTPVLMYEVWANDPDTDTLQDTGDCISVFDDDSIFHTVLEELIKDEWLTGTLKDWLVGDDYGEDLLTVVNEKTREIEIQLHLIDTDYAIS